MTAATRLFRGRRPFRLGRRGSRLRDRRRRRRRKRRFALVPATIVRAYDEEGDHQGPERGLDQGAGIGVLEDAAETVVNLLQGHDLVRELPRMDQDLVYE